MSSVTMWKAIYSQFGREHVVQVPGTKLEPGANYYHPQTQKGHLHCFYCKAGVHFNGGTISTAGSSAGGVSPHFVTDAGEKHADCLWEFQDPSQNQKDVDYAKGYRLHINTAKFSSLFNQRSGVYEISENGRKRLNDPDMRDREIFVIRKAEDIVKFLMKADTARINDSKVVFQNNDVTWEQFFVRAGKRTRLLDLVERLEAHRPGTEPLFAAVEVTTTAYHDPFPRRHKTENGKKTFHKVPPAPIDRIEIGKDARGKKAYVQFAIYIDERDNTHDRDAMLAPDTYLVMGEVRYKKCEYPNSTYHRLNIKVTDGRQVVPVNIENIHQTRMAARQRRDRKSGQEPKAP